MQKELRKNYTESLDKIRIEFLNELQETRSALEKSLDLKQVETFDFKKFNKRVQQFESDMEQNIFKIISLQAPISKDLRFLLSTLKSSNDLRRIGKTIQRISKVSKKYIIKNKDVVNVDPNLFASFQNMGESLKKMFDQVLEIYHSPNGKLTQEKAIKFQAEFSQEDDNVDSLFKESLNQLVDELQTEIDSSKQAKLITEALLMIRHMERVGDHLCNIAERILYVDTGEHYHIS